MKGAMILAFLGLLASPESSRGDEAMPILRKNVLSAGIGMTQGGLGGKYIYRVLASGPAVSVGAGLFGYGLELGFPVHHAQSKSRELFLYGGVLRWQSLSDLDLGFFTDHEEGSHTWVVGLGPRLWPDQSNRVYVSGGVEWQLSNEHESRWNLAFEGGVGF